MVTAAYFSFSPSLFFRFLSRNLLPKGSVCHSISCVKKIAWSLKSFVYIDCFRTHAITQACQGKTTKTFPEVNR